MDSEPCLVAMCQHIATWLMVLEQLLASIDLSKKDDRHDRHEQSEKLIHISPSLVALRLPGTPPVLLYLIPRNSHA